MLSDACIYMFHLPFPVDRSRLVLENSAVLGLLGLELLKPMHEACAVHELSARVPRLVPPHLA